MILSCQKRNYQKWQWFLVRLLGPLLKAGLLSKKNGIKSLVKSGLTPLGLTAAGSEAEETIHKKSWDLDLQH